VFDLFQYGHLFGVVVRFYMFDVRYPMLDLLDL
jgi:hypothetical protein